LLGWTEESGLMCRIFFFHPTSELCRLENLTIDIDASEPTSTVNHREKKNKNKQTNKQAKH
jgi:hypothetical protein